MRFSLTVAAFGFAAALFTTACGAGPTGDPNAVRATFSASPTAITVGQKSTLTWKVQSGSDVTIDNGIGAVSRDGSIDVNPTQSTTYTMTVQGSEGATTLTATVKVASPDTGGGSVGAGVKGVLTWKRDENRVGLYDNETSLTPANVTPASFGKFATYPMDGLVLAQPLYVDTLDMGSAGVHDVVIGVTEHGTAYAFDADSTSTTPLWKRSLLSDGASPMPDNYGGRSTFNGEVGVTGTPVIDPATGDMYLICAQVNSSGQPEQWLHEIDVRTGNDVLSVPIQATKITATVDGDGEASVNGQITFDPSIQNQRPGLLLLNGIVYIAWGSFSDHGAYHGWVMAYDAHSLQQIAVYNSATKYEAVDIGGDHGGGASFWAGGAGIAADGDGNIYIVSGDGTFDADKGGPDYGDTVLKLRLVNNQFQIVDWFTPSNQDCLNAADLEIGSGGVGILPSSIGNGRNLVITPSKEGRVYVLDRDMLGHYAAGDTQIPQTFMVGKYECVAGQTDGTAANSTTWNRLYATPSYWNGNVYMGVSNGPISHYTFTNGKLGATPTSQSSTICGNRGCNTIITANGTTNGILWAYEKNANGVGVLHAYDATNLGNELWNSMMTTRDQMNTGIGFATPIDAGGSIITAYDRDLVVYKLLK